MTPDQELQNAIKATESYVSPEVRASYREEEKSPDQQLDEALEATGSSRKAVQTDWESKRNAEAAERLKQFEADMKEVKGLANNPLADAVLIGPAMSANKILQSAVNLIPEISNLVADTKIPTWKGTFGDDPSSNELMRGMSTTAKVTKVATDFALPIGGAIGKGMGILKGMGAGSLYQFIASGDPETSLTTILNDTELGHVPIVGDVLDAMAIKPDDSEVMKRFKAAVDPVGQGAGLAIGIGAAKAIAYGASRFYSKASQLKNMELPGRAQIDEEAARMAKDVTPITPKEENLLNYSDKNISTQEPRTPRLSPEEKIQAQADLDAIPATETTPAISNRNLPTVDRILSMSPGNDRLNAILKEKESIMKALDAEGNPAHRAILQDNLETLKFISSMSPEIEEEMKYALHQYKQKPTSPEVARIQDRIKEATANGDEKRVAELNKQLEETKWVQEPMAPEALAEMQRTSALVESPTGPVQATMNERLNGYYTNFFQGDDFTVARPQAPVNIHTHSVDVYNQNSELIGSVYRRGNTISSGNVANDPEQSERFRRAFALITEDTDRYFRPRDPEHPTANTGAGDVLSREFSSGIYSAGYEHVIPTQSNMYGIGVRPHDHKIYVFGRSGNVVAEISNGRTPFAGVTMQHPAGVNTSKLGPEFRVVVDDIQSYFNDYIAGRNPRPTPAQAARRAIQFNIRQEGVPSNRLPVNEPYGRGRINLPQRPKSDPLPDEGQLGFEHVPTSRILDGHIDDKSAVVGSLDLAQQKLFAGIGPKIPIVLEDGRTITIQARGGVVRAENEHGQTVGFINLGFESQGNRGTRLVPKLTRVEGSNPNDSNTVMTNRGKNIASSMYAYGDKYIGRIQNSQHQTSMGVATRTRIDSPDYTDPQREQVLSTGLEPQAPPHYVEERNMESFGSFEDMDPNDANYSFLNEIDNEMNKQEVINANNTPEELAAFQAEAAQTRLYEPAVVMNSEGAVEVNAASEDLLALFNRIRKTNTGKIIHTATTIEDLQKGADILKKNPGVIQELAQWTAEKGPIGAERELVMQYLSKLSEVDMEKAGKAYDLDPSNEALAEAYAQKLESHIRMLESGLGQGSQAGLAMRARQEIEGLVGAKSHKEAAEIIGEAGRKRLRAETLRKHGGVNGVRKTREYVKLIREAMEATDLPDYYFSIKMGEVIKRSKNQVVQDAIATVAINGMLSSVETLGRAGLTGPITFTKRLIDNYATSVFGIGSADGKSFAEANIEAAAMLAALGKSMRPAIRSFMNMKAEPMTTIRLRDTPALDTDEMRKQAPLAWVEAGGIYKMPAVNRLTAGGTPIRALIAIDTYWNRVVAEGMLTAHAWRDGKNLGLTGEALDTHIKKFMDNAPADVLADIEQKARKTTFSQAVEGKAQQGAMQVIGTAQEVAPIAKVIMPFPAMTFNGMDYAIQNSPLALASPKGLQAIRSGGRARHEKLAEMSTATMAIIGIAAYAAMGHVEGDDKDTPKTARGYQSNRKLPAAFSIKVGDTWFSTKNVAGLDHLVKMGVALSEAASYLSEKEYAEMVYTAALAVADAISVERITENAGGFMSLVSGEDEGKRWLADFAVRLMPMGGAIKDAREIADSNKRYQDTSIDSIGDWFNLVATKYADRIPFFSNTLPPKVNFFGDTVKVPAGFPLGSLSPISMQDDDKLPMKRSLEALESYANIKGNFGTDKFQIPGDPKTLPLPGVLGGSMQLTPSEQYQYKMLIANRNPETGKHLDPSYPTLYDAFHGVLNKYGVYGKELRQLTAEGFSPDTYFKVSTELAKITVMYKKRAEAQMNINLKDRMKKEMDNMQQLRMKKAGQ